MSKLQDKLQAEYDRLVSRATSPTSNTHWNWYRLPSDDDVDVRVRILPSKDWDSDDPSLFFARFGVHWIAKNKVYCPRVNEGVDCPVCNAVFVLYDQGNATQARRLRVQERALINVLTVEGDGYSTEPLLFDVPKSLLRIILSYCVDPDYGDLSHPRKGFDFRVIRHRGENGILSYENSRPARLPRPIPEDVFNAACERMNDVHEVVKRFSTPVEDLERLVNEYLGELVVEEEEVEVVDKEALLKDIEASLNE